MPLTKISALVCERTAQHKCYMCIDLRKSQTSREVTNTLSNENEKPCSFSALHKVLMACYNMAIKEVFMATTE